MSTTTASIVFRKTRRDEWAAFGPADLVKPGPVLITRRGEVVERVVTSVSRPFDKDGVPYCFGYLAPAGTAPSSAPTAPVVVTDEFPPTAEQQVAIDLFLTGESLKVTAVAGAGKTATLKMMAERVPHKHGIFTAFNRAIVRDADKKMPKRTVNCTTAHALALAGTPADMAARFRAKKRPGPWQAARHLGIDSPFVVSVDTGEATPMRIVLAPDRLANYVLAAIKAFCQSADPEVTVEHFPYQPDLDLPDGYGRRQYANNRALAKEFIGVARRAWMDLSHAQGFLFYDHEHYLKQFALSEPDLGVDYVMVDEAQDMSPVMMSIVEHQIALGRQVVMVGDSMQAINGFTGCIDALATESITNEAVLTKSWRFGPEVAAVANRILDMLDGPVRVTGNDAIRSVVGPIEKPACFLSRTNAGAVRRLFEEIEAGGRPHLVGNAGEIISFCRAALVLMDGGSTQHSDLSWASSWDQVVEYVTTPQGADLALMVTLITDFGAAVIIDALERQPAEEDATLVVSTAHKVKGREWVSVQLGPDFPAGKDATGNKIPVSRDDLMLLYVAVTRGRRAVDFTAVGCLA